MGKYFLMVPEETVCSKSLLQQPAKQPCIGQAGVRSCHSQQDLQFDGGGDSLTQGLPYFTASPGWNRCLMSGFPGYPLACILRLSMPFSSLLVCTHSVFFLISPPIMGCNPNPIHSFLVFLFMCCMVCACMHMSVCGHMSGCGGPILMLRMFLD